MFPAWTPRWSGRRGCRPPPTALSRCGLRRPVSRGRRCWTEAPAWRGSSCTDPAGEPAVSMDGLERAYREEWTTVVAALARRLDDLQAAEDAAAEAFAAAARTWPRDGIPPNPGGWLWTAPATLEAATSVNCPLSYQTPAPYSRFPRTLSAAYPRSMSEAYPHCTRTPSPSWRSSHHRHPATPS